MEFLLDVHIPLSEKESAFTIAVSSEYYRMDDEGFFNALRQALTDMRLFPDTQKKS